ncbi:uncharacterized protein LOC127833284 isoform X3 [Dreissena polymorpha]|uniref:Uncharacterized protein n=2 Tax=Dreissena polymorpha TaxID=45954 RepID=A0A9D4JJG1_DREPO|nr:uncharacterized protein LOC127833284 isoform X3 [Dreissena polymorpha]KAH3811023.1 hypothetical protein DPMN_139423 [Dreissena polymorpha]
MNYLWDVEETQKIVYCYKDQQFIARCVALHLVSCSKEEASANIYNISSDDMTSVTIIIFSYKQTLSGNYSCVKENERDRKTICLTTETTTLTSAASSETTTLTSAPSSGLNAGQKAAIAVPIVVIALVVVVLLICLKRKGYIC